MDEEINDEIFEEEDIPEKSQTKPLGGIQTLPKLPDTETDSEKLTRIEAVLDKLLARLGDEEDSAATYENMVQYFTSMKESTDKMIRNLDKEVNYTRNLEDRLSRNERERDNLLLKKRLDEDHAKLILIYEDMKKLSEDNFAAMRREIETLENDFQEKYQKIDKQAAELKSLESTLESMINKFRDDMVKASDTEYIRLSGDCTNVLTACNQRMTEIKSDVISFLKSCQGQNQELINKIPEQKRKFSWKDIIIYALSGVCSITSVITLFVR